MSSWYVLSAMGFYAVTPGMDYYTFGSPMFKKVTINLENGKSFVITSERNSRENVYIKSASLNNKKYNKSYISHNDIMNGVKEIERLKKVMLLNWVVLIVRQKYYIL